MNDGSKNTTFFSSPSFFIIQDLYNSIKLKMIFDLYSLIKEPEDILAYLTAIQPGKIVLVASFDDVTAK